MHGQVFLSRLGCILHNSVFPRRTFNFFYESMYGGRKSPDGGEQLRPQGFAAPRREAEGGERNLHFSFLKTLFEL